MLLKKLLATETERVRQQLVAIITAKVYKSEPSSLRIGIVCVDKPIKQNSSHNNNEHRYKGIWGWYL